MRTCRTPQNRYGSGGNIGTGVSAPRLRGTIPVLLGDESEDKISRGIVVRIVQGRYQVKFKTKTLGIEVDVTSTGLVVLTVAVVDHSGVSITQYIQE